MKKQYMQPEWKLTMFVEDAITTSGEFSYGSFISIPKNEVESWGW